MTKDLGAGTSGWLDPEGRNWETTVYQASKPVLDKELNLTQDNEQDVERRIRLRSFTSGWIAEDLLDSADMTEGIWVANATADRLEMPQDIRACVNGWMIRVASTGSTAVNILDLSAAPAGAGAQRTDMVVLEVWRRLLDAASVSVLGKSPAGRIWLNGNVKIAAADDLGLNFVDDIEDGTLGSESTKRVQIQYRLRVIDNVDLFANPYGIDDPIAVANSVPAAPAAPDGVATLFNYTNQTAAGDPGLWRAGDGSPANTLGTVDGYMYAIPLMAIVRRNTTLFDRNTNHNGAEADPGPSTRPDVLFHDIFVERDIVDLRLGTSPTGWDFQEVLDKNFNFLLDNSLETEIERTLIGGGYDGHTVFWADEIGISNVNGGDSITTGDTPGAQFIGEFDAVRRRFSDRPITEVVHLRYVPADGSGGGPNWGAGDTITIDPSALKVYPYAAFSWNSYTPADISIVDISKVEYIGGGLAKETRDITSQVGILGLGGVPQGSILLDVGSIPGGITDEDIFIRVVIEYPAGVGLAKTPTADFGTGSPGSVAINNPGQLPAGAPVLYSALETQAFDFPHREINLTYRTLSQIVTVSASDDGVTDLVSLPERAVVITAISINGGPYVGPFTIIDGGFTLRLDATTTSPGDDVQVTFAAIRPLPQNDEQLTIYYEARAPQTGREALLGTSLRVIPRYISDFVHTITVGSGSPEEAFPFPTQYVQSPGVYPTSGGTFSGSHELDGLAMISVSNFSGETGYIKLPTLIGYVPNPQEAIFDRLPGDVDAENRSYFKEVPTSAYIPNAFATPLSDPKRHKVMLPMIAEMASDTPLGFRGQLVMVVLSRWADFDENNSFGFDSNLAVNTTTASVYRIKGNLLNGRLA